MKITLFFDLGGRECECKPQPYSVKNQANICNNLCQSWNIELKGCSACTESAPHDKPFESPTHEPTAAPDIKPPPTPRPTTDHKSTTTPDWREVCSDLCKNGLGGQLCNCDLSPLKSNNN